VCDRLRARAGVTQALTEANLVPILIAADAAAELQVAPSSLAPNRPRFLAVLSVPSPRLRRSEIAGGRT
jgi:hypothetical protein